LFSRYGIPLLFIEWSSGRYGGKFGNHTPYILDSMVKGRLLKYWCFGIFTNIAIASYYCYIESWTMSYVYHTLIGTFDGMSQSNVAGSFDSYTDILTTGLPSGYFLCDLFNIEYVHFIKRNRN
jgi:SNF family Na+-dependent transporter